MASTDEGRRWYGQVVWFWRRDPGVKSVGVLLPATVTKKAAHRGEHEVRRKTIAWGMSECSPLNLYASVPFLCARAHETAGAARTPAPPRPLLGGSNEDAQLGRNRAAGSRIHIQSSSPGLPPSLKLRRPSEFLARRSLGGDGSGRSSIPEAPVIEPISSRCIGSPAFAGMTSPGGASSNPTLPRRPGFPPKFGP
jgi:hypothetical protein